MAFNISTFASKALPQGGARAGLFKISIPKPAALTGHKLTTEKFALSAQASTIPPGTIEAAEVSYFGRVFKLPGGRTFDEWTTTVLIDEDYVTRDFIEQWMDRINGNTTNRQTSGDYMQDLTVEQFSKAGDVIRKYTMIDAWPSSVGEVALDWAEASTIQTFDVSWQFQWWESAGIANKTSGETSAEVDTSLGSPIIGAIEQTAKGLAAQGLRNLGGALGSLIQ